MIHHATTDYGIGKKNFTSYALGILLCIFLTAIPFFSVINHWFTSNTAYATIIYSCALAQFIVQLVFFLRVNTMSEQSRSNIYSLLLTALILAVIIAGS